MTFINLWSQEPDQQPEANPGCRREETIRNPGGEFGQKTALQFTNKDYYLFDFVC